jgi:hypothetical protein
MLSISMLIASIVLGGTMMVNSFQGPGGSKPRQKPVQVETKPEEIQEVGVVPAPGQDGK